MALFAQILGTFSIQIASRSSVRNALASSAVVGLSANYFANIATARL